MTKKERPILSDLVNAGTSKTERFQNEVIRPIIKMQHNLLVVLFQDYTKQRKIDFVNLDKEKQIEKLNSILIKDTFLLPRSNALLDFKDALVNEACLLYIDGYVHVCRHSV